MEQLWKRYAVSAIDSRHNVFWQARARLTAQYVLVVALVVLGFSLFLFQSVRSNLQDASNDDFSGAVQRTQFVDSTLSSFAFDLILADAVILTLAAWLSYVLAGRTLRPIQEAMEAQKTFTANASHELRTPLAVMKSEIEVATRDHAATTDSYRRVLESNLEEISRMSSIVEDLLILARSDAHQGYTHSMLDLVETANGVISKMKSLASQKGLALITTVSHDPIVMRGNRLALERALMNLIQNSIEHTPSGGTITVSISRDDTGNILTVTDTGSGIGEHDLSHVFERFYKGDRAGGTGLGLPIVKEIVTQHGGEINIESVGGTTVAIVFPTR